MEARRAAVVALVVDASDAAPAERKRRTLVAFARLERRATIAGRLLMLGANPPRAVARAARRIVAHGLSSRLGGHSCCDMSDAAVQPVVRYARLLYERRSRISATPQDPTRQEISTSSGWLANCDVAPAGIRDVSATITAPSCRRNTACPPRRPRVPLSSA
jgi:hypothetical protein